ITKVNHGQIGQPVEYYGLGIEEIPFFTKTDVLSVAVFLEFLFGAGGGNEHNNAAFLAKLESDLGAGPGESLWRDLRSQEEPDAPVTTEVSFPYLVQGAVNPAAVAIPDTGSLVAHEAVEVLGPLPAGMTSAVTGTVSSFVRTSKGNPAMSNFVAITGANAVGGHPILVGGPQTSYLVPELLYEFSVSGGGLKTRGVAPIA